ncbi:hypothetical protein JST97_03530 [bacterium]|nr:hypothetical protein [bacterium]
MQIAELTPSRLAEIGRPTAVYPQAENGLIAVASHFQSPFWAGRADLNFLFRRWRLSLYRSDWDQRLGVFDQASFPINDVAFHPHRPLCAIATGCYDGGYLFEGQLWIWDWESDRAWSVLAESREVRAVQFTQQGFLELRLRPRDEEEFPEAPFETGLQGLLTDWRPYRELGLSWGEDPRLQGFSLTQQKDRVERPWHQLLPPNFQPRYGVQDVVWQDRHILATQATCPLECWGEQRFQCFPEGQGVQLFSGPEGALLHLLEDRRSSLFCLRGQQLTLRHRFEGGYLLSFDRHGHMLARHTDQDGGPDLLFGPEPMTLNRLGHFDCFNHALRLDGGERPYYLRGTPASSHQRKVLCALDPQGKTQECFDWDSQSAHLMENRACFAGDGSLIRAYKVHSPKIQQRGTIDCLEMPLGRLRWRVELSAAVTCLCGTVYGLADGSLGCLDLESGQKLWEQRLRVDGVQAIPLCLQLRANQLACGTHDGRVLQIALEGSFRPPGCPE